MSLFTKLNADLATIPEADILVMPPPPIQGVGNDAGFTMQVELRDGSFDMAKLQSVTNAIVPMPRRNPRWSWCWRRSARAFRSTSSRWTA